MSMSKEKIQERREEINTISKTPNLKTMSKGELEVMVMGVLKFNQILILDILEANAPSNEVPPLCDPNGRLLCKCPDCAKLFEGDGSPDTASAKQIHDCTKEP